MASAATSWITPVTSPMTSDATARAPVTPIRMMPTSLSLRNGRGGAFSNARLIPPESAEKTPRELQARKAKPMIVMLPRDSVTASITPPMSSGSSGDPAATCSTTNWRASASPSTYDPTTTPSTRSWKMDRTPK